MTISWKRIARFVLQRLKEPSGYAGLGSVLLVIGVKVDPTLLNDIVLGLAGLAGIIAFFIPEGD